MRLVVQSGKDRLEFKSAIVRTKEKRHIEVMRKATASFANVMPPSDASGHRSLMHASPNGYLTLTMYNLQALTREENEEG
jgi:hypothetical protein